MVKKFTRKKLNILRGLSILVVVIFTIALTAIFALLGVADIWKTIPEEGIKTFSQWSTLILYRVLLYVGPALALSFYKFDKRFNYINRFIIWLNWTLAIYFIISLIFDFFGINMIIHIELFKHANVVIALAGYVLTFVLKKKIEFDSTGVIIGEKPN